jgi:hypothetical protein
MLNQAREFNDTVPLSGRAESAIMIFYKPHQPFDTVSMNTTSMGHQTEVIHSFDVRVCQWRPCMAQQQQQQRIACLQHTWRGIRKRRPPAEAML